MISRIDITHADAGNFQYRVAGQGFEFAPLRKEFKQCGRGVDNRPVQPRRFGSESPDIVRARLPKRNLLQPARVALNNLSGQGGALFGLGKFGLEVGNPCDEGIAFGQVFGSAYESACF